MSARLVACVLLGALLLLALTTLAVASVRAHVLGASASSRCGGVELWAVKTLTDVDAASVTYSPKAHTIGWLRDRIKPKPLPSVRVHTKPEVEFQVFRLSRVYLVESGREEDRDIHLVIRDQDPSHTMIVEFPDTTCPVAASSAHAAQMLAARRSFVKSCHGLPPKGDFEQLSGRATITGVGFFDKKHSRPQRGVAPNQIELHPVLSFTSSDCEVKD
jgi:hypothetical protein